MKHLKYLFICCAVAFVYAACSSDSTTPTPAQREEEEVVDPNADIHDYMRKFDLASYERSCPKLWSHLTDLCIYARDHHEEVYPLLGDGDYPYFIDCGNQSLPEATRLDILYSWVLAMQLSELVGDDVAASERWYTKAYSRRDSLLLGYEKRSDPTLLRLIASVMYTRFRAEKGADMSVFRMEMNTQPSNKTLQQVDDDYRAGTMINCSAFLPSGVEDPGYPVFDMTGNWNRQQQDTEIQDYLFDTYSLDATDIKIKNRTIQSISDKHYCENHLACIFSEMTGMDILPDDDINTLLNRCEPFGNNMAKTVKRENLRRRPCQVEKYRSDEEVDNDYAGVLGNEAIETDSVSGCPSTADEVYFDGYPQPLSTIYPNSYPSGHSAIIWNLGLVMIEVCPDKWQEIVKRCYQYAENRIITRYHWQSDVLIGLLAGSTCIPRLHSIPEFEALQNKAKQEARQ